MERRPSRNNLTWSSGWALMHSKEGRAKTRNKLIIHGLACVEASHENDMISPRFASTSKDWPELPTAKWKFPSQTLPHGRVGERTWQGKKMIWFSFLGAAASAALSGSRAIALGKPPRREDSVADAPEIKSGRAPTSLRPCWSWGISSCGICRGLVALHAFQSHTVGSL